MKVPMKCRECESTQLLWNTHNKTTTSVAEGRLRSNEVSCVFVLGCEECSATLKVVTADDVAAELNTVLQGG